MFENGKNNNKQLENSSGNCDMMTEPLTGILLIHGVIKYYLYIVNGIIVTSDASLRELLLLMTHENGII